MDSRQTIGAVLGDRYEILAELGEGGFGTVYKARQLATGQFVAIKVLHLGASGAAQAREKRIARFQREMQLCGQLHHPNIVRLIDSGQADEAVVYSVFEFVPGKDLSQVLAGEGPLDPREARHFMLQILDALGCAHAQGVIHRDLKPANLMIIPTGVRRNTLVLDFGIGALTEEAMRDEKTRLTLTNESVGTPAYAAPEQLRGQPPTPRSDLYAWGLVFLECLTGKRAVDGDSAADVIFKQLSADPISIPAFLAEHPLGDLLRRVTAKDAAARNVTTDGLLRELEECDVSGLRQRGGVARLKPAAPDMQTATVEFENTRSNAGLSKRLVEGERRQITAMCCTLSASSTARGRVDMEELDQLLGLQQEACTMIARRFNGHVAGVLGDRVLFYFGYPTAREDAARRAAQAALEITADLRRRREALEAERKVLIDLRIGIHTGIVIARELRDPTIAGIGYVVGTTPKLAAGLSAAAEPGSILVSGETQRLLRRHFALEEDGARSLDGFEAPVEVFQLREGSASGGLRDVPLVGRARELDMLLERWGRVCSGAGQAVLITGEPGIGKSRLARELEEKIGGEAHTWLESRSTPDSANSAFYPIVDLLARLIDPRREVKLEDRAEKLEALLSLHGFDLAEAMPLFAPLLSIPLAKTWAPLDVSPQKQRELLRNAVLSLLFEMAEKEPVTVFIEDLHWADPSTLELLGQLVSEVGSARVLALFTARPEFAPSWSPTAALQLQLGRLGRPEIEQMAMKIIGGRALPAEVLDMIAGRTDGVPLFVEELVLAMIEASALVEKEGRYALAKPLSEVAIPGTLRDLLVARLDRLGRAKETAQVAAAIGREFTFELLRAVSPLDEAKAQEDLDRLVAAELVHRKRRLKGAAYLFKHALVRDAAYESMLKRSRQQVHARIAKALEEKFPEVVSERPDLLAHHYAAAEQKKQAIGYARLSALGALQRAALVQAIAQGREAMGWLSAIDDPQERAETELGLVGVLGPALMMAEGYAAPAVGSLFARARELCAALGASAQTFPVLWGAGAYYAVRADHRSAAGIAESILAVAEREGDPALIVPARLLSGGTKLWQGNFGAAHADFVEGLRLHDPDMHAGLAPLYSYEPGVATRSYDALALWFLGRPDQAIEVARDAAALAGKLAHFHTSIHAEVRATQLHLLRHDSVRALELAKRIISMSEEKGLVLWQAMGKVLQGAALSLAFQLDEAGIADMCAGIEAWASTGAEVHRSWFLTALADAYLRLGRTEDGLAAVDEALAFCQRTEDRIYEAESHRVRGELLLLSEGLSDRDEQAEACFAKALDIAHAQHGRALELRAATSAVRLWKRLGQANRARDLLQGVYGAFDEGFDTPDLEDAAALLRAL